jgi:hypothetical protein
VTVKQCARGDVVASLRMKVWIRKMHTMTYSMTPGTTPILIAIYDEENASSSEEIVVATSILNIFTTSAFKDKGAAL